MPNVSLLPQGDTYWFLGIIWDNLEAITPPSNDNKLFVRAKLFVKSREFQTSSGLRVMKLLQEMRLADMKSWTLI